MTVKRSLAFILSNASVAIFFDGFWLLGYRIQVLDDLSGEMGYFQSLLWFVCFFLASFFSLNGVIEKRVIGKCLGLALLFCFLQYFFEIISTVILGPYLDPWF
jgi:hypothetical protein